MTETATTSAAPRSRATVRQAWVERLARFPASGLTPARFCAAEGVSLACFYSWKRRLSSDTPGNADGQGVARLLPVRRSTATTPLELVLPSGAILRIGAGADHGALAGLVKMLGVAPC
jgi:hypothetical protein